MSGLTTAIHEGVAEVSFPKLLVGLIFGYYIPNIILIILSIVFAIQNWNISCDGTMMPLPTWLLVFAIVETVFLIQTTISSYFKESKAGANSLTYGILLSEVFLFVWNIVGAIALFRDSGACEKVAYNIWALTLAILIISWIGMCCFCCCCCLICCGACAEGFTKGLSSSNLRKFEKNPNVVFVTSDTNA
jgi:hypothetical protein